MKLFICSCECGSLFCREENILQEFEKWGLEDNFWE
jgi:hypothetical protein